MVYDHPYDSQIYKKSDSTCDIKVLKKVKKPNPEI